MSIDLAHKIKLSFWQLVVEDLQTHENNCFRAGFLALVVYRFGVWRMGIRSRVIRVPFSVVYKLLFYHCTNKYGIEIPYTASIGRRVKFEHQHGIVVHGESVIGDDCIIRQGVTLGIKDEQFPNEAPRLGCAVSVGAGAKLLGAIRIGDRAKIGANAVVLQDVPNDATAVGIPARIIPVKSISSSGTRPDFESPVQSLSEAVV